MHKRNVEKNLLQNHGTSIKLGAKPPWVKGTHVLTNKKHSILKKTIIFSVLVNLMVYMYNHRFVKMSLLIGIVSQVSHLAKIF